jgi:hypothetical protein
MLESETPVTGFTAKLFELEDERRVTEAKLEELTAPQKAVALHPAARERYLQVVDDLAAAINVGKPAEEIVDAVRELIDSVVVEKTLPGEPIRLKVNGRLAALIGEPVFPEGSLSGVKMVAGEGLDTTSQNNSTKTTNCRQDQPHVSCACDTAASVFWQRQEFEI